VKAVDSGEAVVGPNAITQLGAALNAAGGNPALARVFGAAGIEHYIASPPQVMIPQTEAIAAHRALRTQLPDLAQAIAFDAGLRTADYLLAHRIPKAAQLILKALPARQAARLFLPAITAHAWTFSGSGRFSARITDAGCVLEIAANPLAADPCAWHQGVFTRLFSMLIDPRARIDEIACTGAGAPACVFAVTLSA
jgi:divinyl protochlorophyllide a 8-vinyl-reductase